MMHADCDSPFLRRWDQDHVRLPQARGSFQQRTMRRPSVIACLVLAVFLTHQCLGGSGQSVVAFTTQSPKLSAAKVSQHIQLRQLTTSLSSSFYPRNTKGNFWGGLPSNQVVEGIDSIPASKRLIKSVTVADVATAAGVSLAQAKQDCRLLAAALESSAKTRENTLMIVNSDGELVFAFPLNVKAALERASPAYKWRTELQPLLSYVFQISFGISLLVSLAPPSPYWVPFFFFSFWVELMESVLLCTLVYRNPNERLHERQIQKAATYIRSQGGAVIAEQLLPFLLKDVPSAPADGDLSPYANDRRVLSIVEQLHGEIQVTGSGYIVYTFPELQTTAATPANAFVAPFLFVEKALPTMFAVSSGAQPEDSTVRRWFFEDRDFFKAWTRGIENNDSRPGYHCVNSDPASLQEQELEIIDCDVFPGLVRYLGFISLYASLLIYCGTLPPSALYPLSLAYAVLFNLTPVLRWVYLKWETTQITQRNERRKKWQAALSSQSSSLQRKLQSSRQYKTKIRYVDTSKDIIYDTTTGSAAKILQEQREKS
jgi:hypothetical protein